MGVEMRMIEICQRPKVFNAAFLRRLSEANAALRQLRDLGCKVRRQSILDHEIEIVVDHNPHRQLVGCEAVHVTCAFN